MVQHSLEFCSKMFNIQFVKMFPFLKFHSRQRFSLFFRLTCRAFEIFQKCYGPKELRIRSRVCSQLCHELGTLSKTDVK